MVDVSLVSLPSANSTQSASPTNAAESVGSQDLGPIASLPVGTTLAGFVLNRDAKGNPILRTSSGDFLLKTPLFLKIGSDVVVRVAASGANFRANLVTVDGMPPEEAANLPAHGADADTVAEQQTAPQSQAAEQAPPETQAASTSAPASTAAAAGRVLNATMLLPSPESADFPSPPQTGTLLSFRVVSAQYPQSSTPQAPEAPAASPPGAPVASAALPGALLMTSASPAASPPFAAYARANSPPLSPAQPAPLSMQTLESGATAMEAIVFALTDEGAPVLSTPLGTLQLQASEPLPVGSRLLITMLSSSPPADSESAAGASAPELAGAWTSLQQIVSTLSALAPGEASGIAQSLSTPAAPEEDPAAPLIPSPSQLTQTIQGFAGLLQDGNLRDVLGERAVRMLQESGHAELLDKAESDFSTLRALFSQAPSQQWQALFVPLMMEGEIRPLRLFVKRDRAQEKKKAPREPADTRFVVETEFTALGAMQLDGFLKKREEGIQFDLIIRSHAPLSDAARQDILAIYNSAGEITGFKGMLMFQQTPEFPVRPLEDIMAERHRAVVV